MKKEDLFQAIGEIDDEKILQADEMKTRKPLRQKWVKIALSAACLCVVLAMAGFVADFNRQSVEPTHTDPVITSPTITVTNTTSQEVGGEAGDTTTTKKAGELTTDITQQVTVDTQAGIYTTTAEIYYETLWKNKSMPGKFRCLKTDNREYVYPFSDKTEIVTTRQGKVMLRDKILEGTDEKDITHTASADVLILEGFDKSLVLGVRFIGDVRVYPYINTGYIPETLGEFLSAVDFYNAVTFGGTELYKYTRFPVNDEVEAYMKEYLFKDETLKNITNADGEKGICKETTNRVTVSVSCQELNILNKCLYIYEDGYIATNLIGYEYTFFVGKENVDAFLQKAYNSTFEELKKVNESISNQGTTYKELVTSQTTQPYIPEAAGENSPPYIPTTAAPAYKPD